MSAWVYIVRCADGTLYTGAAKNVDNRIIMHNSGKGAKYTKSRLPVTLVFRLEVCDYKTALSIEWHLKRLTKPAKLKLIDMYQTGTVDEHIVREFIQTASK